MCMVRNSLFCDKPSFYPYHSHNPILDYPSVLSLVDYYVLKTELLPNQLTIIGKES